VRLLALIAALALSGCTGAGLRPDYATAALVHQSTMMHGPGPAPFGDTNESPETTMDGIQASLVWERGRLFWDGDITYALRERNYEGGPWVARFRVGIKVKL
jgi:hypothetical protein